MSRHSHSGSPVTEKPQRDDHEIITAAGGVKKITAAVSR
jgi:hypothetical protein